MKEKILVSACLMGVNCKYNGGNNYDPKVAEFLKDYEIVLICPEVMGGLPTPRVPSEIKDGRVVNKDGKDVTDFFVTGAEETLFLAKKYNIKKALLKTKSPSCGNGKIYDGTFTDTLTKGDGITAKLLKENGIEIITLK
jgi:uncharacterized protein YbbK (DUF523 family)